MPWPSFVAKIQVELSKKNCLPAFQFCQPLKFYRATTQIYPFIYLFGIFDAFLHVKVINMDKYILSPGVLIEDPIVISTKTMCSCHNLTC